MSAKSVQENVQDVHYPKTDSRYWKKRLFKNSYTINGEKREVSTWSVKIAYQGRRENFNLETSNASAAATKAAQIYKNLVSIGWKQTLDIHKPNKTLGGKSGSIGAYIAAASKVFTGSPATLREYVLSLRQIAADIGGIDRNSKDKFNYYDGSQPAWVARIDELSLSIITAEAVEKWKFKRLQGINSPLELRTRKTTVNTTLRKAKSLWSAKLVKLLIKDEQTVNPFDGVDFFERGSHRYLAKFDPEKLIQQAVKTLDGETLKAFILLIFCGLRRGEVDYLEWSSFDSVRSCINIQTTKYFRPKSEHTIGAVPVDSEVLSLLTHWRMEYPEDVFVLRSDRLPAAPSKHRRYRCEKVFSELLKWLKTNGIEDRKPLHVLRKACGDVIARKHGILSASRFLRHGSVAVTAGFYADGSGGVTLGLGEALRTEASLK